MHDIQGCLFDMDGLLLDTERVGMAVFRDVIAVQGLAADAADALYRSVVGKSLEKSQQAIHAVLPGVDIDAVDIAWRDGLDAAMAESVPLRPTVEDALARVQAHGVPMAVVTTTRTDRARHHLEMAGLLPFFRDVIGRDRVTNPKPHPEPYLKGAEILGLMPSQCAAFEDSDTGTRAAVDAGCQVWQIPDLRPEGSVPPQIGQSMAVCLAEAVTFAGF